jgi:hypothetical protein
MCGANIKAPSHVSTVIHDSISAEDMQSQSTGCEKAKQYGKSCAFKLNLPNRNALDTAPKMPIKIDFEHVRI